MSFQLAYLYACAATTGQRTRKHVQEAPSFRGNREVRLRTSLVGSMLPRERAPAGEALTLGLGDSVASTGG